MRKRRLWAFFLLLFFGGGALFLFFLEKALEKTIVSFALTETRARANLALQEAVREELARLGADYQQLFYLEKDAEGQVTFLQPNVVRLSQLAAEITLAAQEKLCALSEESISIPWGQILGSKILAAYGPRLGLTLVPAGAVAVRFEDQFEAAGINQTRHQLYLSLSARVKVMIPLLAAEIPVETRVLLAEAVIVGRVPWLYFEGPRP